MIIYLNMSAYIPNVIHRNHSLCFSDCSLSSIQYDKLDFYKISSDCSQPDTSS